MASRPVLTQRGRVHAFCWLAATAQLSRKRLSASPLKRLSSIFLGGDSFVCKNRVTQREPGMADGYNRSRSSERKLGFFCQGLAFAEVCLAVFERDHGSPPKLADDVLVQVLNGHGHINPPGRDKRMRDQCRACERSEMAQSPEP